MQARLKIVSFFLFLGFCLLLARLFYWQVLKASDLSKQARSQHELGRDINAPRGNILAKDGTWLAAREDAYQMYAELPNLTETPKKIANKLAPFFIGEPDDRNGLLEEANRFEELLTRKGVVWIPLKNKIDKEIKANIEALGISGIGFEATEARIYPEASAAAHLLGFVGKTEEGADTGYFGLEGYYNLSLQGKPGFLEMEKDALGKPISIAETKEISAISGVNLLTHIDKRIQLLVEKELLEGLEKYSASSGTVIIMDPYTGAIMAMSSYPSYEPDRYWDYGDEYFKNPAVSYTFEPGSVFKVVVMASALDAKAVEPDTICDICSGPLKVDKYTIETWDKKYFPDSTMTEIIVHSDNVGMTFISEKLGSDALSDYLEKFGFGQLTNIDLQGEVTPKLREKQKWNVVDLATASFGQGIAITPIQLIKSVSIIANGGIDIAPQVIDELQGPGWKYDIKPQLGDRVISEKAARDITTMMVEAASYGESKWTAMTGFKIAGKTGTAQIPIAGHYDEEKTIASFVGFAPEDDPKFVMLVTLKEPQSSPWASETAAPLWYSIAKELFKYLKIQPES